MAPTVVFLGLLFLVLVLLLRFACRSTTRRRAATTTSNNNDDRLPPSPPGKFPIIGHMHLVGRSHPHISLRDLAALHGDDDGILLLHLGQVPNLVVSSPRAAEAILRLHDHALASRPPSAVADILFSLSDVAYAPYGEYWRQARKVVTTHLLSARKVNFVNRARREEVRILLDKIRDEARIGGVVDVTELLGAFVNDVVCRAVSGKFSRDQGRNKMFRELSSGNAAVLGGFNLEDYFPSLANKLTGGVLCAKARRVKKGWDDLLDQIIHEHAAAAAKSSDHEDFIDVLLSLQHENSLTTEQVKVILMDMFAAGTDTSSIVLEYAMTELVRNPHLMAKLQAEIIHNTPHGQEIVKEENLTNMTYLKAVVKETLRLHPPLPLLLPRIATNKCHIQGYTIPAGTRVIVNAWALARDATSWERAEEFVPERFLDNGDSRFIDFKGRDFKFVPFGAGRRICPGMNFGMATVEIMLANLLYAFDWELPPGTKKEDIDMTDVFGLTMRRQHKLKLVPRLK